MLGFLPWSRASQRRSDLDKIRKSGNLQPKTGDRVDAGFSGCQRLDLTAGTVVAAKLKMREGAFGAARVPVSVSVTLPKTKVTDIRASPGAAPKREAEDRRAPPTARLYKSLKGRKSQ
jgi:hypothetical protein